MKPLNCAATRRRLQAFHDDELGVADQIAVSSHLEWCDTCAETFADFRVMRGALQSIAPGRASLSNEQAAVFTATVVSRMKAEANASLFALVHEMFDDMHFVYAGLGAAAAALVCVVIMLSVMRSATSGRPDSLGAIMHVLATPLECESGNDLADISGCRARWTARFQRANETAEQDAIFALEAVITHQGRLANLDALRARSRHATAASQAKLIEGLLDAVSRARFDVTQPLLMPDLSGVVWLVEHATVRANNKPALDLQLPPKKRAAATTRGTRLVRA
jgi:putative zinc finger protein